MEEKINKCKCGSNRIPNLDSDDMIPCWGIECLDCGQFQHGKTWSIDGAIKKWNKENPSIEL